MQRNWQCQYKLHWCMHQLWFRRGGCIQIPSFIRHVLSFVGWCVRERGRVNLVLDWNMVFSDHHTSLPSTCWWKCISGGISIERCPLILVKYKYYLHGIFHVSDRSFISLKSIRSWLCMVSAIHNYSKGLLYPPASCRILQLSGCLQFKEQHYDRKDIL